MWSGHLHDLALRFVEDAEEKNPFEKEVIWAETIKP